MFWFIYSVIFIRRLAEYPLFSFLLDQGLYLKFDIIFLDIDLYFCHQRTHWLTVLSGKGSAVSSDSTYTYVDIKSTALLTYVANESILHVEWNTAY